MRKPLAGFGQHQVAFAQLREPEKLQCFANMKQVICLKLKRSGKNRQIGMTIVGAVKRGRMRASGETWSFLMTVASLPAELPSPNSIPRPVTY